MYSKSPRCQAVPLPRRQVAFVIDGKERLRWHAGDPTSPRPYLFPLIGPSGIPLTRMGHPGAPNHDHHRSIWFAHHRVLGMDFWSENGGTAIRQQQWLAYANGDEDARYACRLGWYDGHDPRALMQQEVIFSVRPDEDDGVMLEIQTSLKPTSETLELEQTNFGLLAVRVANSISAVFGDGILTGSNGNTTEAELFGKPSKWIDYSGTVDDGVTEGITYFDHSKNPSYPSKWHVRDDGWMGASICRDAAVLLRRERPYVLRYLIHAHSGKIRVDSAEQIASRFNQLPALKVHESKRGHRHFEIARDQ